MYKLGIAAAAVVALGGSMFGDTITSATGSFSAFPSAFTSSTPTWISNATPPTTTGTPFWNDASDDSGVGGSHSMNIGYALLDTGGFATTPALLGTDTVTQDLVATGAADPTAFNFVRNLASYNISLLYANSGMNTGANPTSAVGSQVGYYVGAAKTILYNVGQTTSATGTTSFNPGVSGTAYGFYDTVCYAASAGVCSSSETYYTGQASTGNALFAPDWNHFALFQLASGGYVIGFTGQNGNFGEGQGDFQDTVLELKLQGVPEPGTVAIMGLGLAAIGFLGRRRFAKR
jgi:hypothetical protein